MKHYETIYIANPNLADEEYGEILTKFRDSVEKSRGVIIKTEEWGKQKLAYQLKKFDNGFYVLVEYCGEPGMTGELERNLKLDERVLKYQTVKLADKADPEALIQKERESREKSQLRTAEASEEKMNEEPPEEEGAPVERVPEVAENVEKESDKEGPGDTEEALVNKKEDPKEDRTEGPQGTEAAGRNESETED